MSFLHVRSAALPAAIVLVLILGGATTLASASTPNLDQLNTQLSQEQARQQGLQGTIGALNGSIAGLRSQIALVQAREAQVRAEEAHDEQALAGTRVAIVAERRRLVLLEARLARARMLLARQLVSSYESDHPSLVDVVLQAHGFSDLLDRLTYLRDAERHQQQTIATTRRAKAQADATARQLAALEGAERAALQATAIRARALAGMNGLLEAKQVALQHAQAAQQAALQASVARAGSLRGAISQIQAAQAAVRAAAAARSSSAGAPAAGPALGPSSGWAIPSAIVQCESGGQDLPPNGAGASGYYQIVPGTWQQYGGSGPAAYLASPAEQAAVASRIWAGGSGASNWTCAGMVGGH